MSHCTSRCRSKQHTSAINAVIQNGSAKQAQAYIQTCHNAFKGFDLNGRNLLHVAAAHGKCELLQWLLHKAKGSLNTKDKESGWTALHRAIFYGQISVAVSLIKNEASLKLRDNEGLTPLDLCTKDHTYMPFVQTNREIGLYNVYTWGDNSSYTLGHGKESRSLHPEVVELFRKKRVTLKQVLLERYHSIYLTTEGAVYTCGHGRGGRLGLGHEEPTLQPSMVKLPQAVQSTGGGGDAPTEGSVGPVRIETMAAGRDHTLLLGINGRIYSFGSNEYRQLGVASDPLNKLTEPKMMNTKVLMKGPPVKHIAAARFHSVAATDRAVYTWGLNAGQLGHPKGDKHMGLMVVNSISNQEGCTVQLIACSDACTVVVMSGERREGFYILYDYTIRFINFRGAKFDKRISRLCVSGGKLDYSKLPQLLHEHGGNQLQVFWINHIGQLLVWTENSVDGAYIRRVTYSMLGRQLSLLDVSCSLTELLVTSEEGGAYVLTNTDKPASTSKDSGRLATAVPTIDMKIRRVAGVHRATQCSVDPKSTNYAVLQAKEYTCLFAETRQSTMSDELNSLLTTANEMDGTCDLILKCSGERLMCHRYILASRSSYFSKSLAALHTPTSQHIDDHFTTSNVQELSVDTDLNALRFILKYIYTGVTDRSLLTGTESQAARPQSSRKSRNKKSIDKSQSQRETQTRLQEIGRKFGVKSLQAGKSRSQTQISFTLSKYSQWCDVVLTSLDGEELRCHKCILVARMEYFQTMLTGHWMEGRDNVIRLELPVPYDILHSLIVYVYTDEYVHLQDKDVEFMVNVMVVADQLLLARLKDICETLIISQLTIDNVTQVYQLAVTYQSQQLKEAALFMISMNMSEMLELSLLDELDTDSLDTLTAYYRNKLTCMGRRFLGKSRSGPSEEEVDRVVRESEEEEVVPKRLRRRTRTSSGSSVDSDVHASLSEIKIDDEDFKEAFDEEVNGVEHAEKDAGDEKSLKINTDKLPTTVVSVHTSQSVNSTSTAKSAMSVDHKPPSLKEIMSQQKSTSPPDSSKKLKGRRRYRSLDAETGEETNREETTFSRTAAWSTAQPATAVLSLKEVMEKEKAHMSPSKDGEKKMFSKSRPKYHTISHGSSSPLPVADKPAWNIPASPTSPVYNNGHVMTREPSTNQKPALHTKTNQHTDTNPLSPNANLQQIMNEEAIEMKERERNSKKLLTTVQIEEQAIEELRLRYEATKKSYERISVERVAHAVAAPLWKNA